MDIGGAASIDDVGRMVAQMVPEDESLVVFGNNVIYVKSGRSSPQPIVRDPATPYFDYLIWLNHYASHTERDSFVRLLSESGLSFIVVEHNYK